MRGKVHDIGTTTLRISMFSFIYWHSSFNYVFIAGAEIKLPSY